ncbi:hypothetical protein NMY22_g9410 [Coprinellus aureogranulatus]|nr:hypothetical protein NMY22_g9410 [Coprinellus aureogranulatus]
MLVVERVHVPHWQARAWKASPNKCNNDVDGVSNGRPRPRFPRPSSEAWTTTIDAVEVGLAEVVELETEAQELAPYCVKWVLRSVFTHHSSSFLVSSVPNPSPFYLATTLPAPQHLNFSPHEPPSTMILSSQNRHPARFITEHPQTSTSEFHHSGTSAQSALPTAITTELCVRIRPLAFAPFWSPTSSQRLNVTFTHIPRANLTSSPTTFPNPL